MSATPVEVATAWADAFADRDGDRAAALCHNDVELRLQHRAERGHEAVRGLIERQTYGVAPDLTPGRRFARDDRVVAHVDAVLRYVEGGGVAGELSFAVELSVAGGLIREIAVHETLEAALEAAALGEEDELA